MPAAQVAIVHARKAVLGGLSPKDNREIPPLRYDVVRRLKRMFPTAADGRQWRAARAAGGARGARLVRRRHARARGVSPAVRARATATGVAPCRGAHCRPARRCSSACAAYAARELAAGARLAPIVRHMLGLYAGEPGAREFRRNLSEGARATGAGAELLQRVIPVGARPPA